jgi:hypothetical protein
MAYLLLSSTQMVVVEAEASEFSKTNEKIHTHTSPTMALTRSSNLNFTKWRIV